MPFETTTVGQGVHRRGRVFTLRLEPDVEAKLKERMKSQTARLGMYSRSGSLGAFIIWAALKGSAPAAAAAVVPASSSSSTRVLPASRPATSLKSLNKLYGERARAAAAKKKARKKSPGHKLASSRKGKAAGFLQYPKGKKKPAKKNR